jgi:hypothetical protein
LSLFLFQKSPFLLTPFTSNSIFYKFVFLDENIFELIYLKNKNNSPIKKQTPIKDYSGLRLLIIFKEEKQDLILKFKNENEDYVKKAITKNLIKKIEN